MREFLARADRWNPPLAFVLLLATIALAIRMPDLLVTPSLWAEDADRFIEAVQKHGLASIVQHVHGAGYLLLFERLAAAMLVVVPLKYAEVLFHVVSLAVLYFAFVATWVVLPTQSLAMRIAACLAIVFVPVEPTTMYLTLVNTQWILAPVTMLLIVTNHIPGSRHKVAWCVVLALLCLTGPFAVLAAPVVLARMALYRDLKREKLFYASMLVPIALQCVILAKNVGTRVPVVMLEEFEPWRKAIVDNTILQVFHSRVLFVVFALFVVLLLLSLLRRWVRDGNRQLAFVGFALLALAAINLVAGLYSYRNIPHLVGPFATGERYFYLPFMLLIFFILIAARGWLKPIGLFFVGFACLANAAPILSGPGGRGPTYWKSQVGASRFFEATSIMVRPIWLAVAEWTYHVTNPLPQRAPVEKPLAIGELELVGIKAASPSPGVIRLSTGFEGKDLLEDSFAKLPEGLRDPAREPVADGRWYGANVTVAAAADGVKDVTVLAAPQNELFRTFGGVENGGKITFTFEARSQAPFNLSPHLTDYKAGVSFVAPLGPEWREFAFDYPVGRGITKRAGVYLTWHTGVTGKFQVRNVKAVLDARNHLLIRIPEECASHGDIALTYSTLNAGGVHRLDASRTKTDFREWLAQHRYVGAAPEKAVLFAMPNDATQWLKLTLSPPLEMRNLTLRCY
jgi:hypothetical protein